MWWKTTLVILGALVLVFVWGILSVLIIPGEETGPYIVRFVLSLLVGLLIGRVSFVVWEAWTDDDRRW